MPDDEGIVPQRPAEMELARPGDVVFARGSAVGLPMAAPPGWPPDIHPFDLIDANWHMAVRDSVYLWPGDVNANGKQLINAKFDAASKAAAQTPWGQDIDAAGFSLRNAGFVLGSNVAAQLVGYNIYYEGGGWKKQQDGPGLAIVKAQGVAGSALFTSPTVAGATVPNPTAAMVFRDDGVVEIPRHIDAAGNSLRNAGYIVSKGDYGHSWNLDVSSGQWRHVANGYGQVLTGSLGDGYMRLYTTPASGAAGAVAALNVTAFFGPFSSILCAAEFGLREVSAGGGSSHSYQAASGNKRWVAGLGTGPGDFFISRHNDAGTLLDWPFTIVRSNSTVCIGASSVLQLLNTNGERIRVYDSGVLGSNHAIGVESSCMWFTSNANFRWYIAKAPDNGLTCDMALRPAHLHIGSTTEMDLDFFNSAGPTDRKFARVTSVPGKLGLEIINDAYNSVISAFALTPSYVVSSVASITTLPTNTLLDANLGNGQVYIYLPSPTQLAFRVRAYDGVVRQGILNLA